GTGRASGPRREEVSAAASPARRLPPRCRRRRRPSASSCPAGSSLLPPRQPSRQITTAQTVRVPPKRACAPTYRRFRQESMRSTDIAPSRLEAAKSSAKAFLRSLPTSVRVGFVAFAGYAALLAPPGTDHARIEALIDGVSTARRTAIGDGLLEAVAALPGRVRPDPNGTLPAAPSLPPPPVR